MEDESKRIAHKLYKDLQLILSFRALSNAVMVPGNYSDTNTKLRTYLDEQYNRNIQEIENNEWYVNEKSEMKRLAKELAPESENIQADYEPKMNEIMRKV